ncbi:maltase 1-like [Limulus polyphemus]|uniref:alpha-glucosidase n=1 Tax=Limulus polyphemus TaxID=6850 RepID=A0ABM1BQ47_LIMPO|nr:maltase 1-like [Limulus polyphemus]XP_022254812.1 maltase 1-like [Limulus polyphemus]
MENENYKGAAREESEVEIKDQPGPYVEPELDEEAAVKERLTSDDPTKVKFSPEKGHADENGEAKVDIENVQNFVGLGKEELMKYANDPFWIRLRMLLFILFWVLWVAMLIGAVIIIVLAPRCPPPPQREWWQKSSIYQVYVKSFKDSNGDGVGDLKGLTSKLDYFDSLGVKALALNPIYPSGSEVGGYDITNHTDINTDYGTMADFEDLLNKMKDKDMKIILDFVPNHSSNNHWWFQQSEKRVDPYTDYYVWADPKPSPDGGRKEPNNWKSVDGGSAWEWSSVRGQYYLHQFKVSEADLNLRNEIVKEELVDILMFWLNKGVDGFRINDVSYLFEDEMLKDEPLSGDTDAGSDDYSSLNHIYTRGLPETFNLLKEWKEILLNFSDTSSSYSVMILDAKDDLNTTKLYYGTSSEPLADIPCNYELLKLNEDSTAQDLYNAMSSWMQLLSSMVWPNWVLGTLDTPRLANRIGHDLLDGMHMVTMLAKGTPLTFFGDELGMEDSPDRFSDFSKITKKGGTQKVDPSPMQWSGEPFAGFTNSSSASLPMGLNYTSVNVEEEDKEDYSHLKIFMKLNKLRGEKAIKFGLMEFPVITDNIFSMIRVLKGVPGYLVVMNMGDNSTTVNFKGTNEHLPDTAEVELHSSNVKSGALTSSGHTKIQLSSVPLGPKQAAVLNIVPKFE